MLAASGPAPGGAGPALTVAVALASGMLTQVAARHLEVPGIVLLLLVGVLLGPEVAGVLRPETLGSALEVLVGMSVAVILFEGGLSLSVDRLRREAATIRRLITVGALLTAVGGALAARLLMGWSWKLAVPFGTLVVVTGPTVINPLLRRVPVRRNVGTILEGEGVLLDALGAVVAVVALEVVLAATAAEAATGLLAGLPGRLLVGAGLGVSGGFVLGLLLKYERIVPEGLENIFTLSLVLALFEVSEAILPETGVMTAAVAGLVVGNMDTGVHDELKEFKEQLTVLLIGLLFVLLAATVELRDVVGLGWPGVATVAVLALVIRPLNVLVSTAGSDLTGRERAFLAWLAPRGIVAAAVASLFARWLAEEGVPGGAELQALVFLVIAVTVVVQGGLVGPVASALGVRREGDQGWAVVGANPLGRALGRALRAAGGEEVVMVDSSAPEAQAAEGEGFPVVFGNAAEERTLRRAEAGLRRGVVAVTPNQAVNLLVASAARTRLDAARIAVGLSSRIREIREEQVARAGGSVLFGEPVDLEYWIHGFRQGRLDLGRWRYDEPARDPDGRILSPRTEAGVLPLVRARAGRPEPVDDGTRVEEGDSVYFAWPYARGGRAGEWLSERGWRPWPAAAGPGAEERAPGDRRRESRSRGEGGAGPTPTR